jgi:hypothetical protein
MDTPTPNPVVSLLPAFIRALAVIAKDPSLGYRGAAINASLNFAATAVERGVEARNEFKELHDLIQSLAVGEDPPREVWHDFKARADAAEMLFNPPAPEVPTDSE